MKKLIDYIKMGFVLSDRVEYFEKISSKTKSKPSWHSSMWVYERDGINYSETEEILFQK